MRARWRCRTLADELLPLFVALLAWLILGEVLGPVGIAGALILTVAVVVASRYGGPSAAGTVSGGD